MGSIDWKYAYFSIPIAKSQKKYLRFEFLGQLYYFICLPYWLRSATKDFTKCSKSLFAECRKAGHFSTSYIGEFLLLVPAIQECKTIRDTVEISENAVFVVHPIKPMLIPTQNIM